jgi:MoxR-like ATPase
VNIAYLPPEEEQKLVSFDFKQVRLNGLISKERVIELRSVITQEVFLHEALAKYIRRLVGATRPYNAETEWHYRSPSEMVEKCVDLGASPRATICWARLVKVWTLLRHERDEVYAEDVQNLARYVLGHRVWLGPHAASHGVTVDTVIDDIVDRVPVP